MATAEVAMLIGQLVDMKFSRNDEIAADTMGVKVMAQANYDPNVMLQVMKILEQAGSGNGVEFFSTHPSPENRIGEIQQAIAKLYPNGVPSGMIQ
jgi:beta-barrel assembly-enhancing protease